MNFREAESYLHSLGNEVETMKLGLDNIRRLLAALGNPQNNYLKVQIAGTNGKGSVCAFLDSICNKARIPTGTFTSPHLISITERIRINGSDVSEADFARHATTVRETAERLLAAGELEYTPTFFEQVTATALLAFADAKVEFAILETGMGGRYDATTAANAEIAVITRIDLDHQQYLGEALVEIAAEKAAIIRADTKAVVIGDQTPGVLAVVSGRLEEIAGGNSTCREGAPIVLDIGQGHSLPLVFLPSSLGLVGKHQVENANVAVAVARRLQAKFVLSDEHINTGLRNARHPGRLEYIGKILLDGAHNIGGAKALAAYLNEFESRPITLIFGAMNDKNVVEILSILAPLATGIVLTQPSNSRSVACGELLAQLPSGLPRENISATANVCDALDIARKLTPADGLIIVTGSLYLVGEARKILIERSEI